MEGSRERRGVGSRGPRVVSPLHLEIPAPHARAAPRFQGWAPCPGRIPPELRAPPRPWPVSPPLASDPTPSPMGAGAPRLPPIYEDPKRSTYVVQSLARECPRSVGRSQQSVHQPWMDAQEGALPPWCPCDTGHGLERQALRQESASGVGMAHSRHIQGWRSQTGHQGLGEGWGTTVHVGELECSGIGWQRWQHPSMKTLGPHGVRSPPGKESGQLQAPELVGAPRMSAPALGPHCVTHTLRS